MMKLHIAIITNQKFPKGYAASNYIRLLGKGLSYAGANVKIFIYDSTEDPKRPQNTTLYGHYEGISYKYTTKTTYVSSGNFESFKEIICSHSILIWELYKLRRCGKLDFVLQYGSRLDGLFIYSFFCRRLKIPFGQFLTEWPPAIPRKKTIRQIYFDLFGIFVFHKADLLIVISHYLENLVKQNEKKLRKIIHCIRLPILIDNKEWNIGEVKRTSEFPYIIYCSNLDNYIDDGIFILKAIYNMKITDVKLIMIGIISQANREKLLNVATQCNIRDRIIIMDEYISAEELRILFSKASALLSPMHNDVRSKARFPSKIADYLMSASPLVSNDFGEIVFYLKDKQTAFLCKDDTAEGFSKKIDEAILSPTSYNVGLNGKHLAEDEFDYRRQGIRLYNFLSSADLESGDFRELGKLPNL